MKDKLKPFTVPISDELKNELKRLAEQDSRPPANYARMVLEKHVRESKAQSGAAQPAVAA